ncbi:MAG TPA: ABC transporter substrate-binding protein [Acidimicrobiales bacterium]
MNSPRWRHRLVALLALLTLVAAACGSDDDGGVSTGGDGEPGVTAGFDGTTITLGVITPTTGPVAVIGLPLTEGTRTAVAEINAAGGIAGKYPIDLAVEDSAYDAPTAVQKYTALKDQVVMFAQLLGTPIVSALLDSLKEDQILAQPATLDAFWVREPNLIPVGAPYQIQAANGADWWINQEGNDDAVMCWAGHDDPYGDAGLEGFEFAAEQLGFEIAAEVRFASTDTAPEAQGPNATRLAEAGCTFVFLTATPSTTGALVGAAAAGGFTPQWLGQSPTWVNALAQSEALAPVLKSFFAVVTDGGLWGDETIPGMVTMLGSVAEYVPEQAADIYFIFGYAAMKSVAQVLEAAVEAGDLSHAGLLAANASLDTITTDDLFGDYGWGDAADRVPPRVSRIFSIDPESPTTGFFVPLTDPFSSDAAEAYDFG